MIALPVPDEPSQDYGADKFDYFDVEVILDFLRSHQLEAGRLYRSLARDHANGSLTTVGFRRGSFEKKFKKELAAKNRLGSSVLPSPSIDKGIRVYRPIGFSLLRITGFVYSKRLNERLFVQIVADEREEHHLALAEGETNKARWIVIRCWLVCIATAVVHALLAVIEAVRIGRSLSK